MTLKFTSGFITSNAVTLPKEIISQVWLFVLRDAIVCFQHQLLDSLSWECPAHGYRGAIDTGETIVVEAK